MTVLDALYLVARHPINTHGVAVRPVVWEKTASYKASDSPLMVINGRVGVPQNFMLSDLPQPIKIEPLSDFPVIKDLYVNRALVHERLKGVSAYRAFDGFGDLETPYIQKEKSELEKLMADCTRCGACLNQDQPLYSLINVLYDYKKEERLSAIMKRDGILDVDNISSSEKNCPHNLPLKMTLGFLRRESFKRFVSSIFG